MKRRLFLKGLLGASAIAPVVAKAVIINEDPLERAIRDIERYERDTGESVGLRANKLLLIHPDEHLEDAINILKAAVKK